MLLGGLFTWLLELCKKLILHLFEFLVSIFALNLILDFTDVLLVIDGLTEAVEHLADNGVSISLVSIFIDNLLDWQIEALSSLFLFLLKKVTQFNVLIIRYQEWQIVVKVEFLKGTKNVFGFYVFHFLKFTYIVGEVRKQINKCISYETDQI